MEISKVEWLARCAARFRKKCLFLSAEECEEQAEICYEHFAECNQLDSPEDCADEEMHEWTDDGE
jgi:hypothetical protein